jgi:hypothetical protein
MIGGVPYKGMGQSQQLQSPNIGRWSKKTIMLLCYDYQNGIVDDEEDIIFATKP